MLLNIRSWLHVNVVAGNEATRSIKLSFVPVLVVISANNLYAAIQQHYSCNAFTASV